MTNNNIKLDIGCGNKKPKEGLSDIDKILESQYVKDQICAFIQNNKNKKVYFYGTGKLAEKLTEKFDFSSINLLGFIDANKARASEKIKGYNIYHISEISKLNPEVIALTLQNKKTVFPNIKLLKNFFNANIVHDLFDDSALDMDFEEQDSIVEEVLNSPFFQEKINYLAEKYKGKNIYLYGTNNLAKKFIDKINLSNFAIVGFVDTDPQKIGSKMGSYEVFSLEKFEEIMPDIVLSVENIKDNDLFNINFERQTGESLEKIDNLHKQRYYFVSYYMKTLEKEFPQKIKIADVGCGIGYGSYILANELQERINAINSFDISETALNFAREHYSNNKISFHQQNCKADELSKTEFFKDSKYDLITCFEFLEHVEIEESKKLLDFLLLKSDILISSFPIDNKSPYHQIIFSKKEVEKYYEEVIENCPVKKKITNRFIQQERYYIFVIENDIP